MGNLKYKGYTGNVEYDEDGNYFYGHVLGLHKNGISYEVNEDRDNGRDHRDPGVARVS